MEKGKVQNFKARAIDLFYATRALFGSVPFAFFETLAAIVVVLTMQEVAGAVAFVALITLKLVVCDDILPTTLPFLLLSTFLTSCYDSYNTFIVYLPAAPIVVVCALFHFVVYAKPFRCGDSAYGIVFVSLAVTLGGVGAFGLWEYMRGAYYIFGLGFGMLAAYFIMKSQFSVRWGYDIRERFALIMTLVGVLCSVMVTTGYVRRWLDLPTGAYSLGFSRNNISTLLMFAMPFPMFLGIKRKWSTAFTALLFAILCVTTSRGGLIFGTVEFIVCCSVWIAYGGKKKKLRACLCGGVAVLVGVCFGAIIWEVVTGRILADGVLTHDARYTMLFESFENFISSPWLGTGILDDSIAYGEFKKQGAMTWYHMMIRIQKTRRYDLVSYDDTSNYRQYGFAGRDSVRLAAVYSCQARFHARVAVVYLLRDFLSWAAAYEPSQPRRILPVALFTACDLAVYPARTAIRRTLVAHIPAV